MYELSFLFGLDFFKHLFQKRKIKRAHYQVRIFLKPPFYGIIILMRTDACKIAFFLYRL